MAGNVIKLKRSDTENKAPAALEVGEIAINYHDGTLYYKNTAGSIKEMKRLDARLNELDATSMTYNSSGDLETVVYTTGNKIALNYTNGDLTSVDYYSVDGITKLFIQTLTYNANGDVQSTSWSASQ